MLRGCDPNETIAAIRVRGQVQGVGFRPFVWQLARDLGLRGQVSNDPEGVIIAAAGPTEKIAEFVVGLIEKAPPLARISSVEQSAYDGPDLGEKFEITPSTGGKTATGIVPDAATCSNCIEELFDPSDRRYRYAFGNCTHCGPRFSIIRAVPYDRDSTSMMPFEMCGDCDEEYSDPADRRFHAQPIACPKCGPQLWLEGGDLGKRDWTGDSIVDAVKLLRAGRIVAVKGLGGFHLACRAADEAAVGELRRRKRRDAKPFAVMMRSLEEARQYCDVSPDMREALQGPAAPIVLCPMRADAPDLPAALAQDQDHLGAMLPYTPLHHLLMAEMGEPLVMTSGNLSDEPQVITNEDCLTRLSEIADASLLHDRDIVNRIDDSVIAFDREGPAIIRRARGIAPDPVRLAHSTGAEDAILAMGGELKSTFCFLRGDEAVLSQHIGDLEDALALADYRRILDLFLDLYDFTPTAISVDSHPDYLPSQLGRALAKERAIPLIEVPHHHAHFVACRAENGVAPSETTVGIVCDGLGHGADGTLWGGEVLVGNAASSRRIASLPAIALPGGAAAMRQPWRNLVAHLKSALGPQWRNLASSLIQHLPEESSVRVVEQMIYQGVNAPPCSSAGRLFDAVAAALGVHPHSLSFEGQAAMALEVLARPHQGDAEEYPFSFGVDEDGLMRCDLAPMWRGIGADLRDGHDRGHISARFHRTISALMCAPLIGQSKGSKVALSGGVLQNRIVRERMCEILRSYDLEPLIHRRVPASDGGLALGQAASAAERIQRKREHSVSCMSCL